MPNATTQNKADRERAGDYNKYLKGNGIDIGAGKDPLEVKEGIVKAWDLNEGDAQLMKGVPTNHYDFIYSSHCLEHLENAREALKRWVEICKPRGFLYIIIPDFQRYELEQIPSLFNKHHKQFFTIDTKIHKKHKGRVHYLPDLINDLGRVERLKINDTNYNYDLPVETMLKNRIDQTRRGASAQIEFILEKT